MQGGEAGQFEHTGWDVGPQSHGAERWFATAIPQRCDVQAGHLVLHLCGTEEGEKMWEREKSKELEACSLCEWQHNKTYLKLANGQTAWNTNQTFE